MLDYAGIFPPASLELDQAIRNFAMYRNSKENWMQSCFIIPAKNLSELQQYKENLFTQSPPFSFSILGRSAETKDDFISNLNLDLQSMVDFIRFHNTKNSESRYELVKPDLFEIKLPNYVLDESEDKIFIFLKNIHDIVKKSQFYLLLYSNERLLRIFFEVPVTDNWLVAIKSVTKAINTLNNQIRLQLENSNIPSPSVIISYGLKLRTGGVVSTAFPSSEVVAYTIHTTITNKVSLKATAGLHHPISKINTVNKQFVYPLNIKMFGFMNIIGAEIFGFQGLSIEKIKEIIDDENPNNFVFTESSFKWKNLEATIEEIQYAREKGFISFGSCDFDEPREDLKELGLLN